MATPTKHHSITACALAVSLFLAACGGGETTPPPDTTPPTVAISDSVPATTATGPVTFTFTFSEDVGTSFTAEDITVTGGTAGPLTRVSATVYTMVVTPPANATGTLVVSVAAGKFRDLALNDNVAGASAEQAFDTTTTEPPPAPTGTVLADFDAASPAEINVFGGAMAAVGAAPAGGSGNALQITRNGGEVWAGAWVPVPTVPTGSGSVTISARVFSPTAGVRMVAKLEFGDNEGSGDRDANQAVVQGWQTLTWTFTGLDATRTYNRFVMLPNLGAVDSDKTYHFDDITLVGEQPPAPPPTGTVLADFDAANPADINVFGGATVAVEAGPAGGSGNALKLTRNGGEVWAGAWIPVPTVPTGDGTVTISARVFSPTAGIRMVAKLEYGDNEGSGDRDANEAVVQGWQTLTWTFSGLNATRAYNRFVMLPNLGTVDTDKSYHFDNITLVGVQITEPPATATVLANFDSASPADINVFGGATVMVEAGPAGGSGNAMKVTRNGGEVWAGAWIPVPTVPTTPSTATITARVFSPTAGVRMVAKLEYGDNEGSGDRDAVEAVVQGWQTLTWNFPNLNPARAYNRFVMLPNLGTVDSDKSYFFDDITLTSGGQVGGGGDGGGVANPLAAQGSAGPVQIPVLTSPDGLGFAGTGDAIFAGDYRGALDANNNHAGWNGAVTRGLAANGNIGYFQSNSLSTSPQKLEENGWIVGLLDNPGGVPNFFRFYILTAPAASFNDAYFGMYVNGPGNGTVDISQYGSIKFRLWGPAEMYQAGNLNPTLELTLTGAKVEGCTATGSGGTEIKKSFVANQKIGAASTYKLPLAAWTVVGVCGTDTPATAVASVLGALARVVVVVPGTSFNFTNINPDNLTYTSGVNLGPIAFTNN